MDEPDYKALIAGGLEGRVRQPGFADDAPAVADVSLRRALIVLRQRDLAPPPDAAPADDDDDAPEPTRPWVEVAVDELDAAGVEVVTRAVRGETDAKAPPFGARLAVTLDVVGALGALVDYDDLAQVDIMSGVACLVRVRVPPRQYADLLIVGRRPPFGVRVDVDAFERERAALLHPWAAWAAPRAAPLAAAALVIVVVGVRVGRFIADWGG